MTEKLEERVEIEKPAKAAKKPLQRVEEVVVSRVAASSRVSFDQWAKKRNIKQHHMGGMRAFVKGAPLRTIEAWDRLFQAY